MIKWFKRFFDEKSTQKLWCWCPQCKEDLCSNGSFVEDTDLIRYQCAACGNKSEWNFDIAPVPILVYSEDLGHIQPKINSGVVHTWWDGETP